MACRGRCFAIVDGVDAAPVRHEEASRTGMTWFFCPAHLQFHAFFLVDGAPQPFCGECAVLFFDRAHYAVWVRNWDMAAVMSNAADVHAGARSDLDAMLREMDDARRRGLAVDADPLAPPDVLAPDVLREIPKDDWTYTSLGTTLIPHTRLPGLFLLEYRTFHGALAYQPCCKDIDTRGLFKALRPIDQDGDPVFAQVRTWSCIIQAASGLPKELRWVLATIYNFCNDMLRPEVDENTLWRMRPWLLHWLCVCEQLFYHFGIFADTPEVDWFARPKPRQPTPRPTKVPPPPPPPPSSSSTAPVNSADLPDDIGQSGSPRSSACGTVIHHRLLRRSVDDKHETAHGPSRQPRGSQVSIIHAWLASQPHLPELDDAAVFDPTPRGCVSPKTRRSARESQALPKATTTSRSAGSQPAWSSRLNPRAASFEPLSKQPVPPFSSDKEPRQLSRLDDNDGSETDCSSCSCSSSSTLVSISTCTDCDELPELARYGG